MLKVVPVFLSRNTTFSQPIGASDWSEGCCDVGNGWFSPSSHETGCFKAAIWFDLISFFFCLVKKKEKKNKNADPTLALARAE